MPSVVGQLTKGAEFTVLIDADSVGGDGGSNTLPNAVVAESNVTQHEAAIDHDALTNFIAGEHFTEASIDHTAISNIGTNSHATIDTHITTAVVDADFSSDGLMVRGTGTGNYLIREIVVGSAKLTISNGDGVSGNPSLNFGSVALADLSNVSGTTGDGSTVVFGTSPTIVTPVIVSFATAQHNHQSAAGGGTLDAAAIAAGTLADARIDVKYRKWGKVFFFGTAANPVAGGDRYPIGMFPNATTIKFVRYECNGTSTPTVTFQFEKHIENNPFTTRNTIWASNKTATATTATSTSFAAADIITRETLWLFVASVSGSPKTLLVTIEGEDD